MIKSMTSFGTSKYVLDNREYVIEIKSVNHKYSDISIKLNKNISFLEESIRKTVLQYIKRGKVDIYISLTDNETDKKFSLNKELANCYIQELKELANQNNIIDDISVMEVVKLPDVINYKNEQDEEIISKEVTNCLNDALKKLVEMRKIEGEKIAEDLIQRLNKIKESVEEISKISTRLIQEYIVKLKERIKEVYNEEIIDENRLAQEVVIYADKSSIEEEVTRLKSHIEQCITLMNSDDCAGKKLDFLAQEMNREINTIASKANCLNITNLVIEVKTEILSKGRIICN